MIAAVVGGDFDRGIAVRSDGVAAGGGHLPADSAALAVDRDAVNGSSARQRPQQFGAGSESRTGRRGGRRAPNIKVHGEEPEVWMAIMHAWNAIFGLSSGSEATTMAKAPIRESGWAAASEWRRKPPKNSRSLFVQFNLSCF